MEKDDCANNNGTSLNKNVTLNRHINQGYEECWGYSGVYLMNEFYRSCKERNIPIISANFNTRSITIDYLPQIDLLLPKEKEKFEIDANVIKNLTKIYSRHTVFIKRVSWGKVIITFYLRKKTPQKIIRRLCKEIVDTLNAVEVEE